jgi:hypothetical protein
VSVGLPPCSRHQDDRRVPSDPDRQGHDPGVKACTRSRRVRCRRSRLYSSVLAVIDATTAHSRSAGAGETETGSLANPVLIQAAT